YQQIAELFTKATTKIGSSMIIKAWRFLLYQGIMLIIQVRNLSKGTRAEWNEKIPDRVFG
ncbi:hypothetical protein, partial [Heyndrickxia faecalis]|uniref:hypothetical protein n=1 Tax=Heyndrickxia faecalis TaxID=2824910 RepID=UPI0032B1A59B